MTATIDRLRRNDRFSKAVRLRDGYCCRMERWVDWRWVECRERRPLTAAHIYPRGDCGKLWDDERVGITACVPCHDRLDGRSVGEAVRVPPEREETAYNAIMKARRQQPIPTFEVVRRRPPERP